LCASGDPLFLFGRIPEHLHGVRIVWARRFRACNSPRAAAMRPTRTARLSCQYRRIFQSFRRIVRPEVHCPASRPWRPTKSMNVFVTTRAFGVYGHSQRRSPRSAAPRPLRQRVDTALKGVGIADSWPESSSSFSPRRPLKDSRNGVYCLSVTAKRIGSLKNDRGGPSPVVVSYDSVLRARASTVSH
jgi:hypothetical protein